MGYKSLSTFSTGELDPVLHERTTLGKYNSGLAVARNVIIGKTGSALSRPAWKYFKVTKTSNKKVHLYSPPDSGVILEWGDLYVRNYNFDGTAGDIDATGTAHLLTEAQIQTAHFETSGNFVYVFCFGFETLKYNWTTGTFITNTSIYAIPTNPVLENLGTNSATGYDVDYVITYVKSGEESIGTFLGGGKLPLTTATNNVVSARVSAGVSQDTTITEMRVYRRPKNSGAYGFIASTTYFVYDGSTGWRGVLQDLGQTADYTNSPPAIITPDRSVPLDFHGKTGVVYQQRLLVSSAANLEAIFASRPGYQNNFYRDFPLNSGSALQFKCGTSGTAKILRMIDADGLVAFTSAGVFINTGALSPTNLTMDKKGKWKINENLPPLAIPGGVLFVDATTNTIRNLVWSTELAGYNGQEVSIFSNHLFATRAITSWAFQEGSFPLLWVTFDDGTYASFTYEFDQEMRAWTRHDSRYPVEQVCGTGRSDVTFRTVLKGTIRQIEISVPRAIQASAFLADPEIDKKEAIAAMDGLVSNYSFLKDHIVGGNKSITLSPVVSPTDPNYIDAGASITITVVDNALFDPVFGYGILGTVFKFFDSLGDEINLTVTAWTSNNVVTVVTDQKYPRNSLTNPRLYTTIVVVTGLTSLEGEKVSVVVDGYIVGSPNNDVDGYPTFTVSGGTITLPAGTFGAIVHVGRPFTADLETLDIDTMEQEPTLIESISVNKLYIKVYKSAGLFVASSFAANDKVAGMESIDVYDVDYSQANPIVGNRYTPPRTKRVEVTLPGDWRSQGKIAVRQVDPIHFQILSIIPDIAKLERSDR